MKRRVLTTLGFLLLGAVINIAVAWSAAAFVHPNGGTRKMEFESDSAGRPIVVCTVTKLARRRVTWYPGRLINSLDPTPSVSDIKWHGDGNRGSADYAGWPRAALACSNNSGVSGILILNAPTFSMAVDGDPAARLDRGIALSPWTTGPGMVPTWRAVPLRPVWPGFAINTVFYAALLWLLFAAPFALRRWRRIRRGVCPACAYPVGASDVCTECGAPRAVTPKAVAA
jgi:hypothetical protein